MVTHRTLALTITIASLSACTNGPNKTTPSSELPLSDIVASFRFVDQGTDERLVEAWLFERDPTREMGQYGERTLVLLEDGDELQVPAGELTATLALQGTENDRTYRATVPNLGTDVSILFVRDGLAFQSHATLPEPFDITAPKANADVALDTRIDITYAPVSDRGITAEIGSRCASASQLFGTDTSGDDFRAYQVVDKSPSPPCDADLVAWRENEGTTAPVLAPGSTIVAEQRRTVPIHIVP